MTREMMKRVRECTQESLELVRFANPKARKYPSLDRVIEILEQNIPYREERPHIVSVSVSDYSKNNLIETARFIIIISGGKAFEITAYHDLKGRTQEEKEADKTATFPSGLFKIFHREITA